MVTSTVVRRVLNFFGIIVIFAARVSPAQVRAIYTYPVPNAVRVSPQTSIGIAYSEALDSHPNASAFVISGPESGMHSGQISLSADGRTVIFEPTRNFSAYEPIHVKIGALSCLSGKQTRPYEFSFVTSADKLLPETPPENIQDTTLPADFPPITVVKSDNPAPGNLYFANFIYSTVHPYGNYLIIMDSSTNVISYRNMYPQWGQDFRPRANNTYTYYDVATSAYYGLDSSLLRTVKYSAANGYSTDQHELCFLPDGGYALLAQRHETVNMLPFGGDSAADVIFYALQAFDKNNKLVFQWRCDDSGNYQFTDARYEDFSGPQVDYAHCNSIEYDSLDNTFLLSSRSLDEITKISRTTGKIVWRLGGKNNQFTMIGDSIFWSHQHMPRLLPNGHITLFDNGNFRASGQFYSRAMEYALDENAKTITKIWEFRHKPDIFTSAMGSVQRLGNGNTLIGWGVNDSSHLTTEVRPDGTVAFDAKLPYQFNNYRIYKFPGTPRIVNTFISGYVYIDKNGNKKYDSGEGLSGVTVSLSTGASVKTTDSGTYTLPFYGPGAATVTASGGSFGIAVSQNVVYSGKNIEVDFIKDQSGVPAQSILLSPLGTAVATDSAQFYWQAVSGATAYRMQLANNAAMMNLLIDDSSLATTSRKFNKLADKSTYYWRVQAMNEAGWGKYSLLGSFTTAFPKLPPKAATLISPIDSAFTGTNDITFLWHTTSPAATSYKFEADTTPAIQSPVLHGTVYDTTTSIAFDDLIENATYYWHVIAQNDIGIAPPSEVRSFRTGALLSAASGQKSVNCTVSPNPAQSSAHFRFSLDKGNDVSLSIYNSIGIVQSNLVSAKLSSGNYDYIWDASGKPAGVYLYELRIGAGRQSGRFVLE